MVAEYCDVFAALLNNFLLMGKMNDANLHYEYLQHEEVYIIYGYQ